jgi:hypothetical protein
MRTEKPTGPWTQHPCDHCDRPPDSLRVDKDDDGNDTFELKCWEHAGCAEDLKRHPGRAWEIERMKADGRSPGAIAAFAMWHIKRDSAVPRSAWQPVPSVSVTDRLWVGNTPSATMHCNDGQQAAKAILTGETVAVDADGVAWKTLVLLGVEPEQAARQVRRARANLRR